MRSINLETKVYFSDISKTADEAEFNRIYETMPAWRKEKINSYRFKKDKDLSLIAGVLLKEACIDFGIEGMDENIVLGENGKPAFRDSNIKFSISHSGDKVMCAMSEKNIGCDVEKKEKIKEKIADRFFADKENEYIHLSDDKDDAFFRIWTLKESFMKCTGLGMKLPLNEFEIEISGDEIKVNQNICDKTFIFKEYDFDDGYKYSLCIEEN